MEAKARAAFDPDRLLGIAPVEGAQVWSRRDTILYNLGIGFGPAAIDDPHLLPYALEEEARAFPTMATILGATGGVLTDPAMGIDFAAALHGQEAIELLAPLPAEGRMIGRSRVGGLWDRGPDRGAILLIERELRDAERGAVAARVTSTIMLRNDGGFGGTSIGAPRALPTPARVPDGRIAIDTRLDQALLYRMSGDRNPLHSHPEVARRAGFPQPILMGLCSFGMAGRAIVAALAEGDGDRLRRLEMRFARPIFPGETLLLDHWDEGADGIAFEARAAERDVTVLTAGRARLG